MDDSGTTPTGESCTLVRDQTAIIIAADDAVTAVLGWQPHEIIGLPSTKLIHPEDQNSAVAAWFEMLESPGGTATWQGRYATASGGWQWVHATNTNQLDDPDTPQVISVMTPIDAVVDDIAEELRAGKQLLSQLADVIPVGLLQIDRDGSVVSTNEQLHILVGLPPASTVEEQLGAVLSEDRPALLAAVSRALEGDPVGPVELRFGELHGGAGPALRVCELSLRPLTDSFGEISGAIACLSDVTDSVQLRRDLQLRASTDGLTKSLNRGAILDFLELAVQQASGRGSGVAVIYLDLDRFKVVNDVHGHTVGDMVLVALTDRLRSAIRDGDEIGRLGGDEFLIVCPDVPSRTVAEVIAERVRASAHGMLVQSNVQVGWKASLGMSWAADGIKAADLIDEADRRMYAEKRRSAC